MWFKLRSIANDKVNGNFWKYCWEIAAESFGFVNLVHAVAIDGFMMPDLRPEIPRVRNENRAIDSSGFEVLTGYNPNLLNCYLTRLCPNGTSHASETLERAVANLTKLWGQEPDVDTQVTRPNMAPIPDRFWELQKELIVWDRIDIRSYAGEIKKMIPLTLKPEGDEVVAVPCFGVWPVTNQIFFWVPLEVCRVHTASDLWIEFQVHDVAWLQKFADATGIPVEQWVGDHVSRWGWYAPILSGDQYITITPSPGSKPIEVSPSKHAIKKTSAAKSTNKKSAKRP